MHDGVPIMLTIKEAKAKFPGTSEHGIRQFVLSGALPSVKCGRKYLICEQVLADFLMKGNNNQAKQPQLEVIGKIRRLEA